MSLKHISGWVNVSGPEGPVDPGYGRPGGGAGADPGYGIPDIGAGRPDNDLPSGGHPWLPGWAAALVRWLLGPHVGGGPAKPPGYPVVPVDPDWDIPTVPPHPWLPGSWVPVDPGFGKPPEWGFSPADPGYGIPDVGAGRPDNELPGHWVPVDPSYGVPDRERRCGGGEHIYCAELAAADMVRFAAEVGYAEWH